ncbi:PBP1A family penicillin-binding protein [Candidatus Uhrbacteria bacterium]|nr:PBP1A family penicillin-binding protein [Candidatus Uhrbacteria bacterium]
MPIKHLIPIFGQKSDHSPATSKKRRAFWKRFAVVAALVAGCGTLALALFVSMALAWISRDLPDPNSLITRDLPLSTKIFDRTGTHLLYEIHGDENRSLIQIKDIPVFVPQATVAIEDKTFYTHHGISWRGLLRAFVVNTLKGERIKGTSTLTQQLVRNAVLTTERSYIRKFKEILLSLQIERVFSKDQILQMYLNEVPYGATTYGIESAAQNYFGKPAKELTLDEAALLAALPQAPDLYSPYGTGSRGDNRELLVSRQKYILEQMADQGYVTKDQAEEAKKIDTLKKLIPKKIGNIDAPHFVMYVRSLLEDKYGQTTVERKGLKVITSLDYDKQKIAEEEVKKGVEERGEKFGFHNAALISLDPKTGQILAMVGSKDFFDNEHDGQVNVTLQPRQPGSSFKPIAYAAGFIKGYTPDTILWDVNTTFKTDLKDYEPKNYSLKENGPLTVRSALQGSLNIPAVKMLYLVGVGRVLDFAEQLGYTTFSDRSRFGLSLVLGGGEVRLIEHANAYAAFAAEGEQHPVTAILKVEDSSGKTLEEFKDPETHQVMERGIALQISNVLSDNNARAYIFGIHNHLTLPGRPVAAKTGTTNDFHDAWTMGYTPSMVTGVWVGNNDNSAMKRGADGSIIAGPIWQGYMQRALENTTVENFPAPPPNDATKPVLLGKSTESKVKIDKVTGRLATDQTPPDMVEEKTFHTAHNILYYLDKDDPRGPAPKDPTQDPQYWNWENAVQDWVKRNNWNTTSTPPTEYDDVHTADNQPRVGILDPSSNSTWSDRSGTVTLDITAKRSLAKVEIWSEGVLIGVKTLSPWVIPVHFPNTIDKGYHDLTVTAYDDVGNKGTATVTLNLNAEPTPLELNIIDPSNGKHLKPADFPVSISVSLSDLSNAKKVDLYYQTLDGSTRLLSSEIAPSTNLIRFNWPNNPGPGNYTLFAAMEDKNNNVHRGDQINITVDSE